MSAGIYKINNVVDCYLQFIICKFHIGIYNFKLQFTNFNSNLHLQMVRQAKPSQIHLFYTTLYNAEN